VTPEDFLADHESQFVWPVPDGAPSALGLTPVSAFVGRGNHALEVALGTVSQRPRADELRRAWAARYGKAPNPLLLVGAYPEDGTWKASICGPAGDDPPVESGLELGEVERIAAAALAEPSRHAAIRFLASIWVGTRDRTARAPQPGNVRDSRAPRRHPATGRLAKGMRARTQCPWLPR
jgi:hypothetical protein